MHGYTVKNVSSLWCATTVVYTIWFLFLMLGSLEVSSVFAPFSGQPRFCAEAILKLLKPLRVLSSATQAVCGG